jgi:hypothetical protein
VSRLRNPELAIPSIYPRKKFTQHQICRLLFYKVLALTQDSKPPDQLTTVRVREHSTFPTNYKSGEITDCQSQEERKRERQHLRYLMALLQLEKLHQTTPHKVLE